MSDEAIRLDQIKPADKREGFGPFTSAVSATAVLALIVVMAGLLLGGPA